MNQKEAKIYYFDLNPEEEILLFVRQHPVTNLRWLLTVCLMWFSPLIFPVVLRTSTPNPVLLSFSALLLAVWYLLTLGYAVERLLVWYFNVYLLTNKRLIDIDVHGFLHKHVAEARLANIEDVTYSSSGLAATLFDYGDVYIQTAGAEAKFDFKAVRNPLKTHDLITDQLEKVKTHGFH